MQCPRCGDPLAAERAPCTSCGYGVPAGSPAGIPIPYHYGVETAADGFQVLIPKGTPSPMPSPVATTFLTAEPDQDSLTLRLRAGEAPRSSGNELLGTLRVSFGRRVPVATEVRVYLQLDRNGFLATWALLRAESGWTPVDAEIGVGGRLEITPEMRDLVSEIGRRAKAAANRACALLDECEAIIGDEDLPRGKRRQLLEERETELRAIAARLVMGPAP